MDDINIGGFQKDINKMLVSLDIYFWSIYRYNSSDFGWCRFKTKTWIQSWSKDLEANMKVSGCALGYLWEPSTDVMGIKFKSNPSKNLKGINVKPNLAISDLDNFRISILSKRQVLIFCNGI